MLRGPLGREGAGFKCILIIEVVKNNILEERKKVNRIIESIVKKVV